MTMLMDNISGERKSTMSWFLLGSVVLHALVMVYRQSTFVPSPPPEAAPIEIVEVPKNFPQDAQIAPKRTKEVPRDRIAETEKLNNEIDPNAQFLGEQNQKVEKQTKAMRIDDFREKQGTGEKGIPTKVTQSVPPTGETTAEEKAETDIPSEDTGISPEDKKAKGVKRDWKTLSLQDLSVGGNGGAQAATDDKLDGVDHGERTMLSTREYKYFSYYHRIKELLRQYWKPYVERELTRLYRKGKTVKDNELTTKVLVLLDKNGSIQKISKLMSCGVHELDDAALDAFQRAAPFPNPPPGMVDEDGFVRINWDFILTTETGVQIQWRTAGAGGGPNGPP